MNNMFDIKFFLIEALENKHKNILYDFENNYIIKILIDFQIACVYCNNNIFICEGMFK